jgi:sugar O-acyltransferase (sialic acid O-acetyltransferase NeuD family)
VRLVIFGCGGHGREIADIARRSGFPDIAFAVDRAYSPGPEVQGIPVIDPTEIGPGDQVTIALGSGRRPIADRFSNFATIISSSAIVSPTAQVGEGSQICDYAVVNNSAVIGRHFQANSFTQVSHDCVIGDFVTLSPRVSCNGWVEIGDDVFVGAGAIIRNGSPSRRLVIGRGATIGMGAVVTKDVAAGTTVIGIPAVRREP